MLTAHYLHRLPIDHDPEAIRARARTRGALWDDAPNLFCAFNSEVERSRAAAMSQGVAAAVTALDTASWRFSRFLLTENAPRSRSDTAICHEVLHLSAPLPHPLPEGDVT